jgi:tetratricopeptide (TPR) repeat protein
VAARRRLPGWTVVGALVAGAWPSPGRGFANVQLGAILDNPALPTLDGGQTELLSRRATASLFVFFRPQQEHSLDALRDLEAIRRELIGKPVRFVAVVSGSWAPDEVRQVVKAAGVEWPVLVDRDDALYGKLGVRLHPVVGIADQGLRLAAYEHFRQINFKEIVLARLKVLLGELQEAGMAAVLEPAISTTGSPQAEAQRFVNLAKALWKRKNAAQALSALGKSLAAAPSAAAYALQGEILAAGGDCKAALRSFEAALKIAPADAVAQQGRRGCQR